MKRADSMRSKRSAALPPRESALRFCNGLILLPAGLYGALLCFFRTFSLPESQTALVWALPTVFLFLIIYSLPKYRGVAYLVVFLLWGIASFFVLRQVATGAVFVAEQFSTQASAVFTGLGHFAPPQTQEELAACRMFFRVVQFPLVGYLAWAVGKAHSFLLSFLATAPFLAIAAVVGLAPPALPLILLTGFWAAMLLSGRAGRAGEAQAAKSGLLLAPFAFLLAMLVVLVSPPDAYRPSAVVLQARSAVIQTISELLGSGRQGSSYAGVGVPMTGHPGSTDLTDTSELRFTGQTALKVQMDQPQNMYLRGWAGAVYTGSSWQVISEADYQGMDVGFQPILYADLSREGLSSQDATMKSSHMEIENVAANRAYAYLPYQLSQVDSTNSGTRPISEGEAVFVRDAYLKPRYQSELLSYRLPFYGPLSEAMQARISSRTKRMERQYETKIAQVYTQLPESVRGRLAAYAKAAGLRAADGPEDWLRVAQAAADVVANAGTYTQRPGDVPDGVDFVTYFLEERPRGYCIHFASAAAALMRALDVPARYVEGYTLKTGNFKADGNAEITDRQAHAWVEIWVDGLGWTPIEATPGGAATLREQTDADQQPAESTAPPAPATDAPAADKGVKTSHWVAPLLLGLLLIALAAVRLELTRRRRQAFSQANRNRAALAVYAYLCRLARFGYAISPQAQMLARKAKFSRHTLTREELSALQREAEQGARAAFAVLPLWKKILFRLLVF